MLVDVDLIILAGGQGSRLGGRDKAALEVAGRSNLSRVLEAQPHLRGRTVVVGHTPVPDGVLRTLEDPPDGGPVAGIAAGLAALGHEATAWVAVVAVDQPAAAPALTALHRALRVLTPDGASSSAGPPPDALSHVDATGHRQWLLAIYRRAALEAALARLAEPRHTSVRRLVTDLTWHVVDQGAAHVGDVDTWEDVADWERRLAPGTLGGPDLTEG